MSAGSLQMETGYGASICFPLYSHSEAALQGRKGLIEQENDIELTIQPDVDQIKNKNLYIHTHTHIKCSGIESSILTVVITKNLD